MNKENYNAKNDLATAGMVCSIIGFLGVTAIYGLILSIFGLKESKKLGGKGKAESVVGIIIGIVFIVIFAFALSNSDEDLFNSNGNTNKNSNSSSTQIEEKAIEYMNVDLDDIEVERENNAAAAKAKYKGKYIAVKGRLGSIDSDLQYISILSINDEWDFIGIHCTIKKSSTREVVKTLSKNQTITVKGKITDVGEVLGYYLDIDEIIPQ